jgi:hypothetical protein
MFQVVEYPVALPGQCYLCGSGDKSPYIDWGVSIDYHGALYTCFECTGAVATLLGWVSRPVHELVIRTNNELISRNLDLEIQNRELCMSIEHLRAAGFKVEVNESIFSDDIQPPGSVADFDSDILAASQDDDEATRDADEFVDDGTRTSDESSNDKGMDKLHSDDSSFKFSL